MRSLAVSVAAVIALLVIAVVGAVPAGHPMTAAMNSSPPSASWASIQWPTSKQITPTTTTMPAPTPTTQPEARVSGGPIPVVASDATSTDTADWACIRMRESGGRYNDPSAPSGAYGIEPSTAAAYSLPWPVSDASVAAQDAAALQLFAANGFKFSGTWSTASVCGLS